jgi:hypothetical protein
VLLLATIAFAADAARRDPAGYCQPAGKVGVANWRALSSGASLG